MYTIYLSLGSNVGDRFEQLEKAILLIGVKLGSILKRSGIYETEPWGMSSQPDFLNMVIKIKSNLNPLLLLKEIKKIEIELERVKTGHWGMRTIDIDIVMYEDLIITLPELKIPHPLMHKRNFVLVPFAEVAPNAVHPVLNERIETLLLNSKDELFVKPISLEKKQ